MTIQPQVVFRLLCVIQSNYDNDITYVYTLDSVLFTFFNNSTPGITNNVVKR
ncbi:hypothetical protein MGSAQ_002009 [marine sediment metagenome]|uniref:Uncharacterized protein n=1 Tax=marine sediment metagenome TaxID=412755 RepID=A0A1B6NSQ4_9ZZZZ